MTGPARRLVVAALASGWQCRPSPFRLVFWQSREGREQGLQLREFQGASEGRTHRAQPEDRGGGAHQPAKPTARCRGPRPQISDQDLVAVILADLEASPFEGERYCRVWARLRADGTRDRTSVRAVLHVTTPVNAVTVAPSAKMSKNKLEEHAESHYNLDGKARQVRFRPADRPRPLRAGGDRQARPLGVRRDGDGKVGTVRGTGCDGGGRILKTEGEGLTISCGRVRTSASLVGSRDMDLWHTALKRLGRKE